MPKRRRLITYDESIEIIDTEIRKRRCKWNLKILNWIDFDDISQILRIHIFKKWHLYDQSKPIQPWLNRIISNQLKNLIRNNYGNYARPCLKCAAAEGEDFCSIYGKQDSTCPLYRAWEKTKKKAYDTKLPLPLEYHTREVQNKKSQNLDLEWALEQIAHKITPLLKPVERKAFKYLFVDHLDETEVAEKLGYKSNENTRSPGYKQIKNIRKAVIEKVKKLLDDGEIFF